MAKNSLYFIWGEDDFLIDEEIKKIVARIQEESGEEPELVLVDADELSPLQLLETLEFSPLFVLQRVVLIKRPWWLGKGRRKSSQIKEIEKVMRDYLQRETPGQVLILTSGERDGGSSLVKMIEREGATINCKTASSQYLTKWIKNECASRNHTIEPAAVSLMIKSGQDMYYLQNLIAKLCLIQDKAAITVGDIEQELDNKGEIKVFKLTDALLRRNMQASFQAYNQLLVQGEHPIFFLYMIVRQFIALAKVKFYVEKGCGKQVIMDETGFQEFNVRKMTENSRNFTWDEIHELFSSFLQTDIKFKSSGQDDKILMETLIVEICTRK